MDVRVSEHTIIPVQSTITVQCILQFQSVTFELISLSWQGDDKSSDQSTASMAAQHGGPKQAGDDQKLSLSNWESLKIPLGP